MSSRLNSANSRQFADMLNLLKPGGIDTRNEQLQVTFLAVEKDDEYLEYSFTVPRSGGPLKDKIVLFDTAAKPGTDRHTCCEKILSFMSDIIVECPEQYCSLYRCSCRGHAGGTVHQAVFMSFGDPFSMTMNLCFDTNISEADKGVASNKQEEVAPLADGPQPACQGGSDARAKIDIAKPAKSPGSSLPGEGIVPPRTTGEKSHPPASAEGYHVEGSGPHIQVGPVRPYEEVMLSLFGIDVGQPIPIDDDQSIVASQCEPASHSRCTSVSSCPDDGSSEFLGPTTVGHLEGKRCACYHIPPGTRAGVRSSSPTLVGSNLTCAVALDSTGPVRNRAGPYAQSTGVG